MAVSNGAKRLKTRIGISPDPSLLDWVDERTGPGKRFATRTHAFEAGIAALAEQMIDGVTEKRTLRAER